MVVVPLCAQVKHARTSVGVAWAKVDDVTVVVPAPVRPKYACPHATTVSCPPSTLHSTTEFAGPAVIADGRQVFVVPASLIEGNVTRPKRVVGVAVGGVRPRRP